MSKTVLQQIREKKGLSVLALSEKSGVSYAKVWQLDRGQKVESSSFEIKQKIAFALGLNPWDVFPDVKRQMLERINEFERAKKEKTTAQFQAFVGDGQPASAGDDAAFVETAIAGMTIEDFRAVFFPNLSWQQIRKKIEAAKARM
jgi:transcriptional regulator with XRE-family HTH domain